MAGNERLEGKLRIAIDDRVLGGCNCNQLLAALKDEFYISASS